ncbi:MAG TPA: hypothetical protein VME20_00990 [Acidimicrobiales bacterium]|nr:hypothetical protein [Acidimicrobiales bacterium]
MEHPIVKLAAEAHAMRRAALEAARLSALAGTDDDGEWVEGVSYWSDYMTIINLEGTVEPAASSPVRRAS